MQSISIPNSLLALIPVPEKSNGRAGFSLLELLTVMAVFGIFISIATPGWLALTDNNRLKTAQDQTFQAMRQAQAEAIRSRVDRQVSFRNQNGTVQWAIHSPNQPPRPQEWQPITAAVQIDQAETTLPLSSGQYRVRFSHKGYIEGQLGRLTLKTSRTSRLRRCVVVSTLIGNLRRGANQSRPDATGRFCY